MRCWVINYCTLTEKDTKLNTYHFNRIRNEKMNTSDSVLEDEMNHTTDNAAKFIKTCQYNFQQVHTFTGLPSKTLLWHFIAACVVNVLIAITTLFLNGIILMTFWRSSRLRNSVHFSLIMLQSSVDFGSGVIATPFVISSLASMIAGVQRCWLALSTERVALTATIFSIITLSAMNIERYMGVVHPLIHRTKVTKRKVLKYVISVGFLYLITLTVSFVNYAVLAISTCLIMVIFLSTTLFVYIRVFFVASTSGTIRNSPQNLPDERTWRTFSKQVKLAKSCFLVVVCMFVCYTPLLLVKILNPDNLIEKKVLLIWTGTIALMNQSLNSVIFFWKDKMLRKEAKTTLKIICGSK